MDETLLSVGLDIGTTSTQLIVSQLTISNRASSFAVPEMEIADRNILYRSDVHFTPLLEGNLVDGDKIRDLVEQEYKNAGISRSDVDTGAVIITGETSRRENAKTVLSSLSEFAGDFVVATAGPALESILAARGAGADAYSAETGKTVFHMDIGGGTSNLALIENGQITCTDCLNVGGRLIKVANENHIHFPRSGRTVQPFPGSIRHSRGSQTRGRNAGAGAGNGCRASHPNGTFILSAYCRTGRSPGLCPGKCGNLLLRWRSRLY